MGVELNNIISSNLSTKREEFISSEQNLSWIEHESA